MKASYKKLWCIRAKVLVLVVFCLAQISINAQLYVSKNALVVNEISTNSNNDSLVSKNLNEIYASKNAIIIADNKKYNCAPKQLYAKTTDNTKKAITSQKISVKKTIAHYAATSYRAHVISKTSCLDSIKVIINGDIEQRNNSLQERLKDLLSKYSLKSTDLTDSIKNKMNLSDILLLEDLQKIQEENIKKAERYNLLLNDIYVVEIMPIINFIDLEISKYCKKKKIKILYNLQDINKDLFYYNKKIDLTKEIVEKINNKLFINRK
ncbi:hypothetical protein H9Q08_05645 [Chryseobacterium sp. PS-8]|uniref:Uncharacterized protein n=1 Tax=Chryseobacterium indicum TaxID=2766954 RepID=A0ABS9C2K7_9FLAO|nr:hypothetical protein [Chryseobacterium sp. PS-8]MCF2218781.1 hypothetical protein [Chryseobacterium sp. PS-8]